MASGRKDTFLPSTLGCDCCGLPVRLLLVFVVVIRLLDGVVVAIEGAEVMDSKGSAMSSMTGDELRSHPCRVSAEAFRLALGPVASTI